MRPSCLGRALLSLTFSVFLFSACGPSGVNEEDTLPTDPILGSCSSGPTSLTIAYFNENPRTASGDPNLPFTSTLSSNYTSPGQLTGLNGNCLLQDAQFKVTEDDFFPSNIVTATRDLVYGPTAPEFRQVNAFYNATKLRDFVAGLGVNVAGLGTINLIPECNINSNAFFSPDEKMLCLGYRNVGAGQTVWAADDGDVVVHETGHSINHLLASSQTLYSSNEAGAIDEGIADYWAITHFGNPKMSEWFLGSIATDAIRDASQNLSYPQDLDSEIHDDSRILTETLWDIRQSLGATIVDKLVKKTLELLPAESRMADFYLAFQTAAGPSFSNLSAANIQLISDKFQTKGIHRTDSVSGLRLSATNPVYVMDDYTFSSQTGGNCNGQLDVGEAALVMLNFENTSADHLGVVKAVLQAPLPSGVSVVSGGSWGEYFKFAPHSVFTTSLQAAPGDTSRKYAVLSASFLVKATTAGVKTFNVKIAPTNTGLSRPTTDDLSANISFSLSVGNAATQSSCSNPSVWP